MATKIVTETVVRTGHAAKEISVEVPVDSTPEQIREALFEKAANTVFSSEHDSEYHVLNDVGNDEGEKAKGHVRWILDELVKLGFGKVNDEIDREEVVEVMKLIFADLTSGEHRPASYEAHYIYSNSEEAFWSNIDGWTELSGATPFYERPSSVPVSKANDARVVTEDQADVISNYWNQGDAQDAGEKA